MVEISRRTLLSRTALVAGLGVGAGLGFTRTVHHKVATPPPPPPAELVQALDRQRALLAGYDALGSTAGAALPGLRSDVVAHGDALRGLLELYPGWRLAPTTPSSTPSSNLDSTAALAAASKADAAALAGAAVGWPNDEAHGSEVVPVLGSIAACLSVHVEVLS